MSDPTLLNAALNNRGRRWTLAITSGLMLGGSFPPSPVYSLAYVGLIPLLLLLEMTDGTWKRLGYAYVTFFVFHAVTLFWIGGFVVGKDIWMMIAGGAVLLIHPLFYVFVTFLYLIVRKRLGLVPGLIFFTVGWVSYEYSHSLGEFSFPWIALGNSQAYDLARLQIAEFTSTYGISFLILCFNVIGFVLVANLGAGKWSLRSRQVLISFLLLSGIYLGPWVYGKVVIGKYQSGPTTTTVSVGIVQPNIDPWEKWDNRGGNPWASYEQQLSVYINETKALAKLPTDVVVWPETAIPFRILLPGNLMYWRWLRENLDSAGVPVLSGLPYTVFYDSARAPVTASYDSYRRRYYDDYNSTTLLVPYEGLGPVYEKIVLVPFAERIPYASTFKFLIEPLKWNVGIGMWGKGRDTLLFALPARNRQPVRFASMICYESVYPNFVREFVARGSQFLVIMTNDSWWGNTPGAYQHASIASIRAIENRRWIIRAANGGISGFIDPFGQYHHETRLYTSASFHGTIEPRTGLTYYARHGDVFASICVVIATVLFLLALIPQRTRTNDHES